MLDYNGISHPINGFIQWYFMVNVGLIYPMLIQVISMDIETGFRRLGHEENLVDCNGLKHNLYYGGWLRNPNHQLIGGNHPII